MTLSEERLQEFKDNRDPILKYIYNEVVKIRKWVIFLGILAIISIVVGVIAGLGTLLTL